VLRKGFYDIGFYGSLINRKTFGDVPLAQVHAAVSRVYSKSCAKALGERWARIGLVTS
jgi:hypothetical protein